MTSEAKRPNIYLGGPFFNDPQRLVIAQAEAVLGEAFEVYSPSRDGIILQPDATQEDRDKVFEENVRAIKACDVMVAQLSAFDERPMIPAQKALSFWGINVVAHLRDHVWATRLDRSELIQQLATVMQEVPTVMDFSLLTNYSDLGTTWEMGVAWQLGRPIVGWLPDPANRINVMLSSSCRQIVKGIGDDTNVKSLVGAITLALHGVRTPWEGLTQ